MTQNNVNYNDVVKKIGSVITALNSIDVKGKANLMNLGGSIAVLEEIVNTLQIHTTNSQEASSDASSI